jgi:hypothetical protein
MVLSGQLDALVALWLEKEPKESDPVWLFWRGKKFSCLTTSIQNGFYAHANGLLAYITGLC